MLPKIEQPIFSFEIPSTKKKIKIRPFTCKEEKILLFAKESKDFTTIVNALKQIICNCSIDPIDPDKLANFDIEFLYLKLISISVSNIMTVVYHDNEDKKDYNLNIDLNDVVVKYPENFKDYVEFDDAMGKTIGIKLRFPPIIFDDSIVNEKSKEEMILKIMQTSIDKVVYNDDIIEYSECSKEEQEDFFDSLPNKIFKELTEFIENIPNLYYKISYVNQAGTTQEIEFTSILDFFSLG